MTTHLSIGLTKEETLRLLSGGLLGSNVPNTGGDRIVAVVDTPHHDKPLIRDSITQWTIESQNTLHHINAIANTFNMPQISDAKIADIDKIHHNTTASLPPWPAHIEHHLGAEAYLHHVNTTMRTNATQESLSSQYPRFGQMMQLIQEQAVPASQSGPHNAGYAIKHSIASTLTPEEKKVAHNIFSDRAGWQDALSLPHDAAAIILSHLRPNQDGFLHARDQNMAPEILQMSAALSGAGIGFTRMSALTEQQLPRPLSDMVDTYIHQMQSPNHQARHTKDLPRTSNPLSIVIARAPESMEPKALKQWSARVWDAAYEHNRVRVVGDNMPMIHHATMELRRQRPKANIKTLSKKDFAQYPKSHQEKIIQHINQHATGVDINIPDVTRILYGKELQKKKQQER